MRFALIFAIVVGIAITALATNPPRWDANYIVKGTLYIPYAEIAEPFYAWYDKNTKRSRIDYYGGMVKTYQLANEHPFGTTLKLAPITTKTELNKETCLQLNGTSEDPIQIQSILPYVKDFKLVINSVWRRLLKRRKMYTLCGYVIRNHHIIRLPECPYQYVMK